MSAALIRVLYRSLLLSANQLESDTVAGRTLFNALRSGAVDVYHGAEHQMYRIAIEGVYHGSLHDWHRERRYENRFVDARAIARLTRRPVSAKTMVRTQFDRPVDSENRTRELHQRVDLAFEALHEIDDQNALIRDLTAQGIFTPKRRSDRILFRVGDIVDVSDNSRAVIMGWSESKAHAFGELHISYELLLDISSGRSDRSKLTREPQRNLCLATDTSVIHNPALFIHFDGFADGRYIPCSALAARYPEDIDASYSPVIPQVKQPPATPSILQLQFADEDQLVQYLQCDDTAIVQLATASLEGRWIAACGEDAQRRVQLALRQLDEGDTVEATQTLRSILEQHPEYAYGWSKLGTAQLQAGQVAAALEHYERAATLEPSMLDALAGLGTCATRLKRWDIAHRAAVALLRIQPENETARLLLNNAIAAQIFSSSRQR